MRALVAFALMMPMPAFAQNIDPAGDIVVTAPASDSRVKPPTISIGPKALLDRQPLNAADALRGIVGVAIRPNSRGETVPRIRGSDERQSQIFLDGAPLAIPWDARVDLAQLPSGLIGNVTVQKGAVPIEYGANAVAGVVDLQTRRGGANGKAAQLTGLAQIGTLGYAQGALVATLSSDKFEATLAGGFISRDAEAVADFDALPFSQSATNRRTNTKLDSYSGFAAIGYNGDAVTARASILHIDSARGIAPESDRDPAIDRPRFWRYSDWRLTQITINADANIAPRTDIKFVGWQQNFAQRIDAYRDVTYSALRTAQDDDDHSIGARLSLSHPLGPIAVRWSAQTQSSTHAQIDTSFPGAIAAPRLRFRQNLSSIGIESDVAIAPNVQMTLGAGYDHVAYPLTGDKPTQPSQGAWAFSAAMRWQAADDVTVTMSGGKRTRFAAMRELFSEALGRFLPNADLKPETSITADFEIAWTNDRVKLSVNPFFIKSNDTISQRVVSVDGTPLRQRFNLSGSLSYGVDAIMIVPIGRNFRFEMAGTLLVAKADKGSTDVRRLVQRPSFEATAALDYYTAGGFDIRAEIRRTGGAVDNDANGLRISLPASTEFNIRGSVPFAQIGDNKVAFTFAGDNLSNAVVLPQSGLPLAGRTVRIGIKLSGF